MSVLLDAYLDGEIAEAERALSAAISEAAPMLTPGSACATRSAARLRSISRARGVAL